MYLKTLPLGPLETCCYIAGADAAHVVVIDPGAEPGRIEAALEAAGAEVEAVLLTHAHCDHVSACAALLERRPAARFLAHPDDAEWAFSPENGIEPWYSAPRAPKRAAEPLADGQVLRLAGLEIVVIATPGHTPGGVCFHLPREGCVFTGDTLFKDSVGRTDLPGADARTLAASLRRLAALPPETRVYPGHDEATTIGREQRCNVFLKSPRP